MAAETLAGFPVRFTWALDDLRALVSGHPIIAEGWAQRAQLPGHTWTTLWETLVGFALSVVIGVPLGVVIVCASASYCSGVQSLRWTHRANRRS